MKKVMYPVMVFIAVVVSSPALASVTCHVLEGSGGDGTAEKEILAKKDAWKSCISNKVSAREHSRGPVSVDDGILDYEACVNAAIACK